MVSGHRTETFLHPGWLLLHHLQQKSRKPNMKGRSGAAEHPCGRMLEYVVCGSVLKFVFKGAFVATTLIIKTLFGHLKAARLSLRGQYLSFSDKRRRSRVSQTMF